MVQPPSITFEIIHVIGNVVVKPQVAKRQSGNEEIPTPAIALIYVRPTIAILKCQLEPRGEIQPYAPLHARG